MYKIINSNSKGNAILYHNSILVDCGTSYKVISPYVKEIKLVLLTHKHGDHFNLKTLARIQSERPTIRVGTPIWLVEALQKAGIKNVDVFEMGKVYNYGKWKISPFILYHDVENCGYRIIENIDGGKKIFHATDTQHLLGISAKGYDLYAIECNYCEDKLDKAMAEAYLRGEYCRGKNSMATHLSKQQAYDFFFANKKENSELIELHQSSEFYE